MIMRNIARSFIFICILSIVTVAITDDRDTPWLLSWPFFKNVPAPHKIIGGYGDWCVKVEGLHPGLDFAASHGDSVLLPTDSTRIVRACYFNQYSGYALAIGYDSSSTEGWYLGCSFRKITP